MEKLLPEHLKDFWQTVVRHEHTAEDYTREYDRALAPTDRHGSAR